MAISDLLTGAAQFGTSFIGGKKRLSELEKTTAAYNKDLAAFRNQDTSNLAANQENVYEDATVNTGAADFAAQQQNQGLSNIMGSMKQSAGGSGIAALAQSLANQQSQNAQQASVSIGQQEQANQQAQMGEQSRLNASELQGAETSRTLKTNLLGTNLGIAQADRTADENAVAAAQAARAEGIGTFAGGVGSAAEAYAAGGGFGGKLQAGINALNQT
jgi:hypothetical protein